jgi:hypothetical protein
MIGCSTIAGKDAKSFTDMTTKEKASFLMSVYNKQYDSYAQMWKQPDRTEEMQKVLDAKYEWLKKLYPVVDAYAGYAESGVLPPASMEDLALSLINESLGL